MFNHYTIKRSDISREENPYIDTRQSSATTYLGMYYARMQRIGASAIESPSALTVFRASYFYMYSLFNGLVQLRYLILSLIPY